MEEWGFIRWAGAILGSLLLLFGVIVLGHGVYYGEWQLNWWYQQQNVNRSTSIVYHSLANQSALRDEVSAGIAQVDKDTSDIASAKAQGFTDYASSLKTARYDQANQVCSWITQLDNPGNVPWYDTDIAWGSKNCASGVVKPGTQYYYAGG